MLECDGVGSFDLSGFRQGSQPDHSVRVRDAEHHSYVFQPCGTVDGLCPSSWVRHPVVVQSWGSVATPPFPDSCAALGDAYTAACAADGRNRVTCSFTGGDSGRDVQIRYDCLPYSVDPVVQETSPLHYLITLRGPSGCAASNHRERASWASTLTQFGMVQQGYLDEISNSTVGCSRSLSEAPPHAREPLARALGPIATARGHRPPPLIIAAPASPDTARSLPAIPSLTAARPHCALAATDVARGARDDREAP